MHYFPRRPQEQKTSPILQPRHRLLDDPGQPHHGLGVRLVRPGQPRPAARQRVLAEPAAAGPGLALLLGYKRLLGLRGHDGERVAGGGRDRRNVPGIPGMLR